MKKGESKCPVCGRKMTKTQGNKPCLRCRCKGWWKKNWPYIIIAGTILRGLIKILSGNTSEAPTDNVETENDSESNTRTAPPLCPNCGRRLRPDAPEGWYNCDFCGDRLYDLDGKLTSWDKLDDGNDSRECVNCGGSLRGGDYVGTWEDGSNAYPYVICPNCRCKNTLWEFGDE